MLLRSKPCGDKARERVPAEMHAALLSRAPTEFWEQRRMRSIDARGDREAPSPAVGLIVAEEVLFALSEILGCCAEISKRVETEVVQRLVRGRRRGEEKSRTRPEEL